MREWWRECGPYCAGLERSAPDCDRRDREKNNRVVTYHHLTLTPTQYQATIAGDSIDLTPIEFNLLNLLLRHPGPGSCSRTYLLETIWDEIYVEGDRSVDNADAGVYRKKLGDMGDMIETIWGVGYRLRKVGE